MAIAASNTNCPAAALVAEIESHAKAAAFVYASPRAAEAAAGEGGIAAEYMVRRLGLMISAAEGRIDTVRAVDPVGAAFQVARLRAIFGDLHALADPQCEDPAARELLMRFDMVFASVIGCLAQNGGQLPPHIVERYELADDDDAGASIARVVAVMNEAAA